MKIGLPTDTAAAAVDTASRGKAPAKAAASAPASIDKVDLSSAGAKLGAAGSASPVDFDSAKVDAIKEAIRQGKFTVNPEVISDRLIAEASALMRPRSS